MLKKTEKATNPFSYYAEETQLYTDTTTLSLYIPSFDKTLLAIQVTLPMVSSDTCSQQYPVIFIANRKNRIDSDDPEIVLGESLVKYGYAFVSLELRGCGVSFGINNSFGSQEHCKDVIAVTEWISKQNWYNGKIGMLGCSNRAYIQLCTAAYNPKQLNTVTPVVAVSDFYYQNYPNGVSAAPHWRYGTVEQLLSKEDFLQKVVPVDSDSDGSMAYRAFTECHFGNNRDFFETLLIPNLNRDSKHPNYNGDKVFKTLPPYGRLSSFFSRKDVRQHQFIGQLESGTLGQLAHFIDFGGSVCLGPWTHFGGCICQSDFPNGTFDLVQAYKTWYDYSLKDMNNSFSNMPPVSYYMFHAESGDEWRFSESWPPENEVRTKLYFNDMPSGTCNSCNDGTLSLKKPETTSVLAYQVRDDICVFKDENGKSTYDRSNLFWNGDMSSDVDNKGITFTSAPLFRMYNNEMAGCISVELWVSCSSKDVDLIVYAQEVLPDGTSKYIKDGVMRASHRISAPNPAWEKMGATWHTSLSSDVDKCLNEGLNKPTLLKFAIDPIAYHFQAESRLRITITCANNVAFQHYMYEENLPVLTLYTGGDYASNINVPFLETEYNTYKGFLSNPDIPATLYAFDQNVYIYNNGLWNKYSNNNEFLTRENSLYLGTEKVMFTPIGNPECVPHPPYKTIYSDDEHPFPAFRRQFLSSELVDEREYALFVPGRKNLYIDIFKDSDATMQPCIIYIHGYGSPYCALPPQLKLLHRHKYAIAAIDVRNYPPNTFPDYIHDAKGAIRYLRANANKFGLDPDKFATYGFSLGGNTSLMLALTGDNPHLEGSVGGNTEFSSRVQACAAGFAWSSLLDMGSDIAEEFQSLPDLLKERIRMTDGEYSPSSEVIAFAGKGKGLGVLRSYLENGCRPNNELFNQKLQEAYNASPVNVVNPSVPPIALFGGHGMDCINIAFKQSLRTFEALNNVDALVFLYGNTGGEYGEKQETLFAIKAFYDEQLNGIKKQHILSVNAEADVYVYDYVSHPLTDCVQADSNGFWINTADILCYLPERKQCCLEIKDEKANLFSLIGKNIQKKYYEQYKTIIIKIQEDY
ncbi:CocE/NonD family hydrolase [uncultured Robinsoniella sp.]|uniref:CocE/NonD family hydrolase n=1 Tax=uncultured Robinsoniella sp. TaxID=904190 RepID=UPI00374F4A33